LNHLTETILYPLGFFKAVADHRWSMKGDALPPPCQMMHNGKDCTRRAEVAVKRPALSEVRRAALRDHGGYAMRRMKKRYPPLRFVCARCDRPEIPHFGSGIPYVHVWDNRQQKAAVSYDGHNRKAGVSASNRAARNRHNRRNGKALAHNLIRDYVPYIFKQ
jgi:hypothetical protein